MTTRRMLSTLALTAALGLTLTACGSDDEATPGASPGGGTAAPIVIATTNFTETKILASMYEQVLEANGQPAEVKELTTREVIIPALEQGEVQLTPEYLGSLTEYLNKAANGTDAPQLASGDVQASFEAAKELAAERDITLLEPSPAQDQNAFAVTTAFAEANDLATLSDLAELSARQPITLGGPPECPERPFCQVGLEEVYDVQVGEFVPLDAGGPLTIQAVNQGRIDVALVFSSSGAVTANELVVLEDDREWQTAENILPALHTPTVTETVTAALEEVSAVLSTEVLQGLNQQVEIDRADPDEVAREFLSSQGLL